MRIQFHEQMIGDQFKFALFIFKYVLCDPFIQVTKLSCQLDLSEEKKKGCSFVM